MNFGQSRFWWLIARQHRERWTREPVRRREIARTSAEMQARINALGSRIDPSPVPPTISAHRPRYVTNP
jgi:hypothetical protein